MINYFFKKYIYYSNENITGEVYIGRLILSPIFLIFPPLFGLWLFAIHYKRVKALGISNDLLCSLISIIMLIALLFIYASIFAPKWELLLSHKVLLILSFIPFLLFSFLNSKKTKEGFDNNVESLSEYQVLMKDNLENEDAIINENQIENDELQKLIKLKEDGHISNAIFEVMKKRLK